MSLTHTLKAFGDLSAAALYDLLRLRSEVFVVEQNCVFLDQDDKDQYCYHLSLFSDGKLAAYSRLVPAGVSYVEASIGRVVTSPAFRGTGLGRVLMELSIQYCEELLERATFESAPRPMLYRSITLWVSWLKEKFMMKMGLNMWR